MKNKEVVMIPKPTFGRVDPRGGSAWIVDKNGTYDSRNGILSYACTRPAKGLGCEAEGLKVVCFNLVSRGPEVGQAFRSRAIKDS